MPSVIARTARSRLSTTSISSFLFPIVHSTSPFPRQPLKACGQARFASVLGSLSDNRGAYNKRIRRGRGPSSGKGKTSGRGHKGQKQHGKVPAGFGGGQTPDEVVHGKRGFENLTALEMTTVNVDRIQSWVDQGRLDTSRPITIKDLQDSRCLHGIKDGVKLLARNANQLRTPIHITVSRASASAIAAIEAAGGTVTTRYYTRPSIKRILLGLTHPTLSSLSKPETSPQSSNTPDSPSPPPGQSSLTPTSTPSTPSFPILDTLPPPSKYRYRLPDASSRRDLEYYRDPAHRGYLAYQLEEGQTPSLFFKTSGNAASGVSKIKSVSGTKAAQSRAKEEKLF